MKKLMILLALLLVIVPPALAQEVTPEPSPLDVPPALEALVGVWDTQVPAVDKSYASQMIFYPEHAIFTLAEIGSSEFIAFGKYDVVDETRLKARMAGFSARPEPYPVDAIIEIVTIEEDKATLIITLAGASRGTQLELTRAEGHKDHSLEIVGTWAAEADQPMTLRDDYTADFGASVNPPEGADLHYTVVYFLHGNRFDVLTAGSHEIPGDIFWFLAPTVSLDVVMGDEDTMEFYDPRTGAQISTVNRLNDASETGS